MTDSTSPTTSNRDTDSGRVPGTTASTAIAVTAAMGSPTQNTDAHE